MTKNVLEFLPSSQNKVFDPPFPCEQDRENENITFVIFRMRAVIIGIFLLCVLL